LIFNAPGAWTTVFAFTDVPAGNEANRPAARLDPFLQKLQVLPLSIRLESTAE
jgi:hypothetical protein